MMKNGSLAQVDVRPYRGVAYSTAMIYAPYLDTMDEDDVAQELLLKAAQALVAFSSGRVRKTVRSDGYTPEQAFVFMCIKNRVKDLLKAQRRRRLPDGGRRMLHIEDVRGTAGDVHTGSIEANHSGITTKFDARHLSVTADEVYGEVEGVPLPDTLTKLEVAVVRLMVMELNQTEISQVLDVSRRRVRIAHLAAQEKLVDWRPTNGHRR